MDTMDVMDKMRTYLAAGQKVEAAMLLPHLVAAVTGDAREEFATYPVCAACHGTGELPSGEAGRATSCQVEPEMCRGNQMGRMTPVQFQAYMESQLQPSPIVGEGSSPIIDEGSSPIVGGDGLEAYLWRQAARRHNKTGTT